MNAVIINIIGFINLCSDVREGLVRLPMFGLMTLHPNNELFPTVVPLPNIVKDTTDVIPHNIIQNTNMSNTHIRHIMTV